jgi:hypothetical protein
MTRSIIFFLLILFSTGIYADKLEKGFERLKMFDYFSAKGYFEKAMDDDPAAAAYGLAKIFSVNNNPFYSTDSARRYILISDSLYDLQKVKVKNYYRELGVNDSTISELSERICADAFEKAKESETSKAYNHFISFYNSCAQTTEVIELRNAAAFDEADSVNTSEAFKKFMNSYPRALEIDKAQKRYDELIYSENTDSTLESYQYFIQNFPENPYRKQAEKMIYTLSVPDRTIDQYATFARTHSNSPHFKEAWYEVYKLGMPDFSETRYNNFKTTYPDFPFLDELETDYKLANTFFLSFEENEKYGYMNDTGAVMIKPEFDEAGIFKEGLAFVAIDDKYGYINKAGKLIIDYQFKDAESFHNSAAVVLKDSLYGVIDKSGQFILQPLYEELSEADSEIYMAVKKGKSGYIQRTGDTLTGFDFDVANDFKNGFAVVSKDEKSGIIDSNGKYTISPSFDDLVFISPRFLKAMNAEEQWGIVTVRGDTVLPFDYDAIGEFSNGMAMVVKNDKCGYIDEGRSQAIPIKFPFLPGMLTTGTFANGYALLKGKYKSTLIDSTGKTITFKSAEDYGKPSEGLYPVRKNSKWGFANVSGKVVIPCKYQSVEPFSKGRSVVKNNKLAGVIDSTNKEILIPSYTDVILESNAIIVKNNSLSGLFSNDGSMIIPCEYETMEFVRPDIVRAISKDKYQIVNLNTGKVIATSEKE